MIITHKTSGAVIQSTIIQGFSMSESFNSMFVVAKLNLGDVSNSILSSLAIGEEFIFDFEDSTPKTNLRVLKFGKNASQSSEKTISSVSIDFVSSWYFNEFKLQAAYTGSPSSIAAKILSVDNTLRDYTIDFEQSDTRAFTHFRLGDNAFGFLKKVESYALKNNTPMYLYSCRDNRLEFKSFDTFYNGPSKYTIASQEIDIGPKVLNPYSTAVCSDASKASSVTSIKFNYENFMNPEIAGNVSVGNAEIGAELSALKTPQTQIFLDWSVSPNNAYAFAIRAAFQKNIDVLYASCAFVGTVPQLNIGDKIYLSLKTGDGGTKSNPEDAKGAGYYIVAGKSYVLATAGSIVTTVTLVDANISNT